MMPQTNAQLVQELQALNDQYAMAGRESPYGQATEGQDLLPYVLDTFYKDPTYAYSLAERYGIPKEQLDQQIAATSGPNPRAQNGFGKLLGGIGKTVGAVGNTVAENPALLFAAPLAIGAFGGAFGAGAAGSSTGAAAGGAAGAGSGAGAGAIPAGYSGLATIPGAADVVVTGAAPALGGAGGALAAGLGGTAAAGSSAASSGVQGPPESPQGPPEPSGPSIGQGLQGPPEPSGAGDSGNFFHKLFKQFGSMPGGGGGSQPKQAMTMPFVDRSPPQPTFLPINRPQQSNRPTSRDLLIQELGRSARGNRP